jgi:hypothetical protein
VLVIHSNDCNNNIDIGCSFVLAATEHLHHRISSLSGRIRQLEDALAKLQAERSSDPHPLLHEDFMEMEEEGDSPMPDTEGVGGHVTDVIDALGTLSISDNGISRFFGPTGGSEVRVHPPRLLS